MSANPDLFTEEEAASYIGLKARTLAQWRFSGRYDLPFLKVGRMVRYRRADLDKWLDTRLVTAGVSA